MGTGRGQNGKAITFTAKNGNYSFLFFNKLTHALGPTQPRIQSVTRTHPAGGKAARA
jgi:hypothetical protein